MQYLLTVHEKSKQLSVDDTTLRNKMLRIGIILRAKIIYLVFTFILYIYKTVYDI